jgi:hypothetical protein
MEPPTVQIEHHPPERRRRPVVTLYGTCCICCCCCCCLHSVGALVGAAIAPTPLLDPLARRLGGSHKKNDKAPPAPPKSGISAAAIYWWILCAQILVGAVYILFYYPSDLEAIEIGCLVLLFFLPLLQLFSSIITTVIIKAYWFGLRRKEANEQLGKITMGSFIGAFFGVALMVILLVIFRAVGALR